MDEDSIKIGLLMETAQTHQQLAEAALEKLKLHTQGLDGVVRGEIRRSFVDEMHAMHTEIQRTVEALRRVQRIADARVALWGVAIPVLSALVGAVVVWLTLPLLVRGH